MFCPPLNASERGSEGEDTPAHRNAMNHTCAHTFCLPLKHRAGVHGSAPLRGGFAITEVFANAGLDRLAGHLVPQHPL